MRIKFRLSPVNDETWLRIVSELSVKLSSRLYCERVLSVQSRERVSLTEEESIQLMTELYMDPCAVPVFIYAIQTHSAWPSLRGYVQ